MSTETYGDFRIDYLNDESFLKNVDKKKEQFNPMEFLNGDWEDYFHILREWKKVSEEDFLIEHPHLREPKRHLKATKIYIN